VVELAFFVGAFGAVGGAVAVVALRNPFYSVLALVVHLVFLAGIFLLLRAQFLAAAQIVVYAGAVMVIYVFVAAYVGGIEEPMFDSSPQLRIIGPILAVALFIEISIAVLGSSLTALGTEGTDKIGAGFGTPEAVGKLMLEDFLIAFEAASILLLVAAVAAIILAGRKRPEKKVT
jgi:NADH-quinone oxidoreductase subunit J